jgi:hypothetical protein
MALPSSSPLTRRGRTWGVRPRLIVDVVMAVSFLALMSVNLTGTFLHEWWGVALMLLVITHLLVQWDWTLSSTRGFLSKLTSRLRISYVLNWALFVATVLVFVSGLLISENVLPSLGLATDRGSNPLFGFWHQLHILSADTVLVLAAIHLGLNWRWVLNAIKQIFHPGGRHILSAFHWQTTTPES